MLSPGGEASSVVVGGANSAWPENDDELVSTMVRAARGAAVMLLQREVPDRVNLAAAAAAKAAGVPIVVDAGGVDAPIPAALLEAADYLCPNESELASAHPHAPTSTDDEAVAAGLELVAQGRQACWSPSARAARWSSARPACSRGTTRCRCRAVRSEVVDTAAGDAFRAPLAVAVAVAEGVDVVKDSRGLALAAAAGAYAVSVPGAVPSLPTRDEAENLIPEHRRLPAPALAATKRAKNRRRPSRRRVPASIRLQAQLHEGAPRPVEWARAARRPRHGSQAGEVEGIDLVDFNYPQHLDGRKPKAVTGALRAAGLAAGAVAVRFPASRFRAGAFTNPDPSVRAAAVDVVAGACAWARSRWTRAGVIVWPQFDGYDYHLQVNYRDAWRRGGGAPSARLWTATSARE